MKKHPDNELLDAIVGMTNTEGGILYIGVEDSGDTTGTGNGKTRAHILSSKIYHQQENTVGYVHQTGID